MPAARRVSVRGKRTIEYGRKIARFYIGPNLKLFPIQEDLICSHSPFFSRELQNKRQPMEGACAVCHEKLDLGVNELTWCVRCGGNLHHECMENWKTAARSAAGPSTRPNPPPNCPLCRASWVDAPDDVTHRFPEFNATVFAIYIEWIQKARISVEDRPAVGDDKAEPDWETLVQAYILADKLEDMEFRKAVLASVIETVYDSGFYPSATAIDLAYGYMNNTHELRRLFVELYATGTWSHDQYENAPPVFLRDMCRELLMRITGDGRWSLTSMKKKFDVQEEEGGESEGADDAEGSDEDGVGDVNKL